MYLYVYCFNILQIDANGDGTIDCSELGDAIKVSTGISVPPYKIRDYIRDFESTQKIRDGVIDLDEFKIVSYYRYRCYC